MLKMIDANPLDQHATFHVAESYAVAGDHATALELLQRAIDRGFYPSSYIERHCPFFAHLRRVPAFAAIVEHARARSQAFS
jgi:pentatricopeptide repeat protein